MSHETLPLDEVARRTRWMVGSFKQEDIDKVPMRPNQGFEPLVSVVQRKLRVNTMAYSSSGTEGVPSRRGTK
jgi:hypothetical protein